MNHHDISYELYRGTKLRFRSLKNALDYTKNPYAYTHTSSGKHKMVKKRLQNY